jgi:RNA polymerase sigma-70 factor, ECF subfamily
MNEVDKAQPSPPHRSDKADKVKLSEEEGFVRQASEGDRSAFEKLYEKYLERTYRYIYGRIGSISDAEILTSETFTRAFEALSQGRYKGQDKSFEAWLFSIASELIHKQFPGERSTPRTKELSPLLEPNESESGRSNFSDAAVQREERDIFWQLVDKLPLMDQSIIILRHVYDLPYAEIAERFGGSVDACKYLHYAALWKLKLNAQEADLWGEISQGLLERKHKPRDSNPK